MNEYLQEYAISDTELQELKQSYENTLRTMIQGKDRLRGMMKMLLLLEVSNQVLSEGNTEDFVMMLRREIEEAKGQTTQLLATRALDVRNQIKGLIHSVNELRTELHTRGYCIDQIIEGIGATATSESDLRQRRERISSEMQQIDEVLAGLVALRDSEAFVDVCRLAEPPVSAD